MRVEQSLPFYLCFGLRQFLSALFTLVQAFWHIILPFAQEYFLFSPVGFKGNL